MHIESLITELANVIMGDSTALAFALSTATRSPRAKWLPRFRLKDTRTEEQKMQARQSPKFIAGMEMIVLGISIPAVYFAIAYFFFNEITSVELLAVSAGAFLFIALGVIAILKTRSA